MIGKIACGWQRRCAGPVPQPLWYVGVPDNIAHTGPSGAIAGSPMPALSQSSGCRLDRDDQAIADPAAEPSARPSRAFGRSVDIHDAVAQIAKCHTAPDLQQSLIFKSLQETDAISAILSPHQGDTGQRLRSGRRFVSDQG